MGERANAAAELDGEFYGLKDLLDCSAVDALAGKGAVEIDDVEIVKTLVLERFCLRRGIVVEDGRLVHVAELEAHALAVLEVDSGDEDHISTPMHPSPLEGEGGSRAARDG